MAQADTILSVAEVKTQLFIPTEETSQDSLLTSYRDAAIEYVASRTGRLLLDETVVLEVPVRYVPLSSAPFRLADIKRVTQLDYHDEDTQFWSTEWWQGSTADPYFQGYGAWPHYTTYPSHGLRIYRTEADTPPDQQVLAAALRLETVGREHLYRVWSTGEDGWPQIHPYLPVQITCEVGMEGAGLASVKAACLVYVRFLWSQMPEFREEKTIDRLVRGLTVVNVDQPAQRVIQVN